jgi:hypothetical protein
VLNQGPHNAFAQILPSAIACQYGDVFNDQHQIHFFKTALRQYFRNLDSSFANEEQPARVLYQGPPTDRQSTGKSRSACFNMVIKILKYLAHAAITAFDDNEVTVLPNSTGLTSLRRASS